MNPIAIFSGLSRLWQVVSVVALLIVAVWVFIFVRDLLVGTADVEAELGTNQADAAIRSGQDAANTVGENQAREGATDDKVEGITNDVQNADDATAADAAGRDGLCSEFGVGCSE